MEELNFKLGADGSEIPKELSKAKKQLQDYVEEMKRKLDEAGGSAVRAGQRAKATGVQFQGFSRVMQDAAFGPAAIANNLEGLGNDLMQLKQISKDTGQSIGKTLVQSLAGGGGLNLAVGALTLGLSLASFGMTAWTRLFPKNADEVDKAKKKTLEYKETLDDVRRSQLQGSQDAAKELTTLKLLFKQYSDTNVPLKQRQQAYKELQEQYPSYFKNMKFENEVSAKTRAAYDKLTGSILATSRARAAADIITKNTTRQLENEQKVVDLQAEAYVLRQKAVSLEERAKIASKGTGDSNERIALKLANEAIDARNEEQAVVSKINNLLTDSGILTRRNLALDKQVTEEYTKGATLTDTTGKNIDKTAEKIVKVKAATKEWMDLMFAKGRDKAVAGLPTETGLPTDNNALGVLQGQQLKQAIERNRTLLLESGAAYNEFLVSVSTNMASAFSNLFTGILTEGKLSFKALGNAILQEFARVLGSAIVKKLAGLILNFATGGGAGIFGSIFKLLGGAGGKIPGFANGVTNFSGGLAYVHAGEVLTNLAPGTNVIPANQVSGMGGMAQVFIATSYQRADMIVTSYERGERTRGRVV